jgi:pimeloyl-ACP methyl ester carboxylesterase
MAVNLSHFPVSGMLWSRDSGVFSGSLAMLLTAPVADTAIVFVHGWGGSAEGTWAEFPSAIRAMPEAAQADAFFLNYPSRKLSVAVCAGETKEFVHDLLRVPGANVVNLSLPDDVTPRALAWRYARLVLVGHSMGAVVIRRALLDMDRALAPDGLTPAEASGIRLLLFAPAHRGSSLPDLVASGLGLDSLPGASLVGGLVSMHFRSLKDLREDSQALKLLLEDSRTGRARRGAKHQPDNDLHASVLHAINDKVVVQDRFDEDLDGRPIPNRNHRSSCKPSETYRRPVEELRRCL